MRGSIWNNLKFRLSGAKNKWRRTYVTMTTPAEVKLANELKKQLPTRFASYLYVGGQRDQATGQTLAGYLLLTYNLPASQGVVVRGSTESTIEAELNAIIDGLDNISIMNRQGGSYVVVTSLKDLVREYNDFSLAEDVHGALASNSTIKQLKAEIATLALTYRNIRFVAYDQVDNPKAQFLQAKLERIMLAHADSKRRK
ncbi:hypothetical protein ESZ50_09435 [Weissella muntiaci]|uniref:RNase H type-1 domain-containing protein n=1 Tax=Weissella muntiaci TaxID=2508881 RepID=A0A6C2C3Q9_9LACO|nr:hypothetical protein [Weissella muntiaci]TYC48193.1 hypothetical protein ESZ50_09435 [Weissella muntiaci]